MNTPTITKAPRGNSNHRSAPPTVGLQFDDGGLLPFPKLAIAVEHVIGKRIAVSVLHRWSSIGSRGIRLAYLQTPRGRLSSVRAVEEFFRRLTEIAIADESHSGCLGEFTVIDPKLERTGI